MRRAALHSSMLRYTTTCAALNCVALPCEAHLPYCLCCVALRYYLCCSAERCAVPSTTCAALRCASLRHAVFVHVLHCGAASLCFVVRLPVLLSVVLCFVARLPSLHWVVVCCAMLHDSVH